MANHRLAIAVACGITLAYPTLTARQQNQRLQLPAASAEQTDRQQTFRGGVDTVGVYATVQDDAGRLVSDLTREDFEILDDGEPVTITTFSSDMVPITVALLLDMSSSMIRDFLLVRRATTHFFETLRPGDRVRLGTFGAEVALSPHLTGDRFVLDRVLREEVWPGTGTPLWRAMIDGMDSLILEPGRRVVLTLTDGDDLCLWRREYCAGPTEVEQQAEDNGFMVYAVGMAGSGLDGRLKSLTRKTGGGHIELDDNASLADAFARIAEELHRQYTLGFTPTTLDGRRHELLVRCTRPGLTVRARERYIAAPGGAR